MDRYDELFKAIDLFSILLEKAGPMVLTTNAIRVLYGHFAKELKTAVNQEREREVIARWTRGLPVLAAEMRRSPEPSRVERIAEELLEESGPLLTEAAARELVEWSAIACPKGPR